MFKFKNEADYKQQREVLMNEAQTLRDEGKVDEAGDKLNTVEKMDNAWTQHTKELANMAALNDRFNGLNMTNIGNKSQERPGVEGGSTLPSPENVMTDEAIYKNAFGKTLLNMTMTDKEKSIFDNVNSKVDFTNAMTTGGVAAVIPSTLMKGIWQEMQEQHPILSKLSPTFIQGEVEYNKEDAQIDDADWENEADTAVADDSTVIGTIKLTGCELDKVVTVKWKLKKMGLEEFMVYIQNKLSEKMGNALAKAVIKGKGKPGDSDGWKAQPLGIVTAIEKEGSTPQVVTYPAATGLEYETFTAARGKVKSNYANGLGWYMNSSTIWNQVMNILDGMKRPMFIPSPIESKCVGTILGIPVYEEDAMGDGEVLLANPGSAYKINWNDTAQMYTEDHVKQKETDYMEYAIVDGAPITTKAFAFVKKAQ